MSDGTHRPSRQDAAFAALARIEMRQDLIVGTLRAAGFRAVAQDDDARSQYGDVKIAMQMKAWRGPQYKGRRASECSPDFLLAYADMLEGMALRTMSGKDRDDPEKLKYARYNLKDAALCRAWAALNKGKPAGAGGEVQTAPSEWDVEAPAARPTPHSAGNEPEAWAADANGAGDWGDEPGF